MTSAKTTSATYDRALEIVTLWGDAGSVLSATHFSPPRDFVIGDGRDESVDFVATDGAITEARHALVRIEGDRAIVVEPSGVAHDVGDEACVVSVGPLVFRVRFVEHETCGRHAPFDRAPARYVAATAFVAGIFAFIAALAPSDAGALVGDRLDTTHPLVAAAMLAPNPLDEPSLEFVASDAADATAGQDGVAGRPDAPAAVRRRAANGSRGGGADAPAPVANVERSGVLGVLASMQRALSGDGSAFDGDGAIGTDATSLAGALMGASLGESVGTFGLALHGPGRGLGNDAVGTIDTGGLRTHGEGEGDPYGRVNGLCRGENCRASHVPSVVPSQDVATTGSVPREVIQRVVRRHLAEIRFCYEQGLESRPSLEGRVSTLFVIGPSGAVVAAQVASSSLDHGPTETCIASAVRRWSFPAPTDGGLVRVTYPFSLTSGE